MAKRPMSPPREARTRVSHYELWGKATSPIVSHYKEANRQNYYYIQYKMPVQAL